FTAFCAGKRTAAATEFVCGGGSATVGRMRLTAGNAFETQSDSAGPLTTTGATASGAIVARWTRGASNNSLVAATGLAETYQGTLTGTANFSHLGACGGAALFSGAGQRFRAWAFCDNLPPASQVRKMEKWLERYAA